MASLKTPSSAKTTAVLSSTAPTSSASGKAIRPKQPKRDSPKPGKPRSPALTQSKRSTRASQGPQVVAGPKKEVKRQQLIQGLRALKDTCEDVISHFRLKLQSELLEVLQTLGTPDKAPTSAKTTREWNSKTITAALKELQKLKVKPEKGRLKDLAKIHSFLRLLSIEL
jgi:hypothetical protein